MYVMFPATESVQVCDVPGGQQAGRLTRALVNTQEEIDAGGWAAVRDSEKVAWVRLSDLQFVPPANAAEYFDRFAAAYRARDPQDFRSARVSINPDSSGGTRFDLTLRTEKSLTEISYIAFASRVQPLSVMERNLMAEALSSFPTFMMATLVATTITITLIVGVVIWGLATRT